MSRRTGGWAARKQRPRFRPGGILSPTSQPGFHAALDPLDQPRPLERAGHAEVTVRFARGDVLIFAAADLEITEDQPAYDYVIGEGAVLRRPESRRFTLSGLIVGSNR